MSDSHFVMRVVCEKVHFEPGGTEYVNNRTIKKKDERVVTELASYTVKDDELSRLKDRVNAHVSLIEDFTVPTPSRES